VESEADSSLQKTSTSVPVGLFADKNTLKSPESKPSAREICRVIYLAKHGPPLESYSVFNTTLPPEPDAATAG
jgi:hypothetical protein